MSSPFPYGTRTTLPLGADTPPDEIRMYLDQQGGREFLRKCVNDDGHYVSFITGEVFEDFYQLSGHVGAHLRESFPETELTDDRAGYIKAIRRGEEPTDKQREANRRYIREYRERNRASH